MTLLIFIGGLGAIMAASGAVYWVGRALKNDAVAEKWAPAVGVILLVLAGAWVAMNRSGSPASYQSDDYCERNSCGR